MFCRMRRIFSPPTNVKWYEHMGKTFDAITPELEAWLDDQYMFFVATAPLSEEGLINCSPKGVDSFRVLGPREVAYLDLTGSGIETVAHLRENGRIVIMFCAFDGPPKIVRFHGEGRVLEPTDAGFDSLRHRFPDVEGERAIIHVHLTRISDSCGYGVPKYEFIEQRATLERWAEAKGADGLTRYRSENNRRSLDGLPGLRQ